MTRDHSALRLFGDGLAGLERRLGELLSRRPLAGGLRRGLGSGLRCGLGRHLRCLRSGLRGLCRCLRSSRLRCRFSRGHGQRRARRLSYRLGGRFLCSLRGSDRRFDGLFCGGLRRLLDGLLRRCVGSGLRRGFGCCFRCGLRGSRGGRCLRSFLSCLRRTLAEPTLRQDLGCGRLDAARDVVAGALEEAEEDPDDFLLLGLSLSDLRGDLLRDRALNDLPLGVAQLLDDLGPEHLLEAIARTLADRFGETLGGAPPALFHPGEPFSAAAPGLGAEARCLLGGDDRLVDDLRACRHAGLGNLAGGDHALHQALVSFSNCVATFSALPSSRWAAISTLPRASATFASSASSAFHVLAQRLPDANGLHSGPGYGPSLSRTALRASALSLRLQQPASSRSRLRPSSASH